MHKPSASAKKGLGVFSLLATILVAAFLVYLAWPWLWHIVTALALALLVYLAWPWFLQSHGKILRPGYSNRRRRQRASRRADGCMLRTSRASILKRSAERSIRVHTLDQSFWIVEEELMSLDGGAGVPE
jgi:hypothetical protein